MAKPPD